MNVSFTEDSLKVVFTGAEQVFALRQKLIIPKDQIVNMSWHDEITSDDFGRLLRLAGSAIPDILFAGYFRGQGENQFLYITHPKGFVHPVAHNVLIIETRKPFPQSRVMLTLDIELAGQLLSWWRAG